VHSSEYVLACWKTSYSLSCVVMTVGGTDGTTTALGFETVSR